MGSHSVTCHLTQVNAPRLTPAMQADTRFTYPGRMEGWVDLVDLIAPRLEVEPVTFQSRVRRRTAAPPRQPCNQQPTLRSTMHNITDGQTDKRYGEANSWSHYRLKKTKWIRQQTTNLFSSRSSWLLLLLSGWWRCMSDSRGSIYTSTSSATMTSLRLLNTTSTGFLLLHTQESCATAKMTMRCALYMSASHVSSPSRTRVKLNRVFFVRFFPTIPWE